MTFQLLYSLFEYGISLMFLSNLSIDIYLFTDILIYIYVYCFIAVLKQFF